MFISTSQFFLSRAKMIGFLDELEAAASAVKTLYVPGLSSRVEDFLGEHLDRPTVPPELAGLIAGSKTGAVIFWGPAKKYLVLPPFPITEEYSAPGGAVGPLRSLLKRDFRIALVLIRLGAYAVGLCEGESLITSKVGTGLVHGRHRQGGSSAQRFRRHREKQIEYFLNRVCGHIRERLEPEARSLDYVVYGGAWNTILRLQKHCPCLRQLDDRVLPPLLDIPEPRQAVLETAIGRVWSSKVAEWQETEIA